MKRYRGLTMSVPKLGEGEPESIIVSAIMNEDTGGEWVKYADACLSIDKAYNDGFLTGANSERSKYISGETLESDYLECNCREMYESTRFANMDGSAGSWFCPVHGYKKR